MRSYSLYLLALLKIQVMMSTSGDQLLPQDAVSSLKKFLLPLATVITPNIPEAQLLLGRHDQPSPETLDDMIQLAKDLHMLGCKHVLVKGGHSRRHPPQSGRNQLITDVLYDGSSVSVIEKEYIKSKNTHGTGCSLACTLTLSCTGKMSQLIVLAAAIASNVALGFDVYDAVHKACRYVEDGIRYSISRGQGNGPINHFHSRELVEFWPIGVD